MDVETEPQKEHVEFVRRFEKNAEINNIDTKPQVEHDEFR